MDNILNMDFKELKATFNNKIIDLETLKNIYNNKNINNSKTKYADAVERLGGGYWIPADGAEIFIYEKYGELRLSIFVK
jgi:hypothetical protein